MTRVPDGGRSGGSRQESLLVLVACLFASCGIVWAIWSVPLVMTNDGPQSLLLAHIDAHYDDAGSIFSQQFSRGLGLSGRGFMFLYAPLEGMAWPNGVRAAQAVMQLAFAWGAVALTSALSGRVSYKGLLGFVFCASWPFYMGFWAYYVASAVGLWVLAAAVARPSPSRLVKLALSVGLFFELLCHPVMGTITYCALALVVAARHLPLTREGRGPLTADALWLLLSAVPNVVVFGIMQGAQADMSKVVASETTDWATLPTLFATLPRLVVPGATALGWLVLVASTAALVRGVLRLRSEPRAELRGITVAALGLFAVAVLGPLHMPGWQYFAPRFLPVALTLCLCLLPEPQPLRGRLFASGGAALVALLSIFTARSVYTLYATACGDALFALDEPRQRTGMVMPIIFDSQCGLPANPALAPVPYMAPVLHMAALFPIRHGGSTAIVFAGPAEVHVLVPRKTDLPIPPLELWGFTEDHSQMRNPATRGQILDQLIVFGTAYEGVQLFGKTEADKEQLIARGLEPELDRGSYLSGRLEPCTVELVVDMKPADPGLFAVAGLGAAELWPGEWSAGVAGQARALVRPVCGELWVKVKWEDGKQRCKNADAEGRIHLVVPVPERFATVRCERLAATR